MFMARSGLKVPEARDRASAVAMGVFDDATDTSLSLHIFTAEKGDHCMIKGRSSTEPTIGDASVEGAAGRLFILD